MATTSAKYGDASEQGNLFAVKNGIDAIQSRQFSPYTMRPAHIRRCKVTAVTFTVEIDDGRTLHASTTNLGPVFDANWRERRKCKVVADGTAVEWPSLGYTVTLKQLMGVE